MASQALALVTSLLSLEDWVLVVWDLDWADLAVTSAGQVVLVGLDKVTPVDKTLLVPGIVSFMQTDRAKILLYAR